MKAAILGGTGVYNIKGIETVDQNVETEFGSVLVKKGTGKWKELYFISRHGSDHSIPPHKINYRANIKALSILGVERVFAIYAVGSISELIPPGKVGLVSQFIDVTQGRINTFYEGGVSGLKHVSMDEPYCRDLGTKIMQSADRRNFPIIETGTYICTNGPRFETPAEIKMYKMFGADYVGMTGATETALAREAKMHFAAVSYSINWSAGIKENLEFINDTDIEKTKNILTEIALEVLFEEPGSCFCDGGL
jgi:purine nucleoside phosphorylase